MRKFVSCFVAVSMMFAILFASVSSFAQGSSVEKPPSGGPRKQIGTIIYAGLGGAVLGLSTLSFYGRPQDKLANIAIGFAIGVIGGTAAVTYNAATNPDDFYGAEIDRETLLGPATSVAVLTNKNADASAPAFFASFELLKF